MAAQPSTDGQALNGATQSPAGGWGLLAPDPEAPDAGATDPEAPDAEERLEIPGMDVSALQPAQRTRSYLTAWSWALFALTFPVIVAVNALVAPVWRQLGYPDGVVETPVSVQQAANLAMAPLVYGVAGVGVVLGLLGWWFSHQPLALVAVMANLAAIDFLAFLSLDDPNARPSGPVVLATIGPVVLVICLFVLLDSWRRRRRSL